MFGRHLRQRRRQRGRIGQEVFGRRNLQILDLQRVRCLQGLHREVALAELVVDLGQLEVMGRIAFGAWPALFQQRARAGQVAVAQHQRGERVIDFPTERLASGDTGRGDGADQRFGIGQPVHPLVDVGKKESCPEMVRIRAHQILEQRLRADRIAQQQQQIGQLDLQRRVVQRQPLAPRLQQILGPMEILAEAARTGAVDARQRGLRIDVERVQQSLARGKVLTSLDQEQTEVDEGRNIARIQADRRRVGVLGFLQRARFAQGSRVIAPMNTLVREQFGQAREDRGGRGPLSLPMQADRQQGQQVFIAIVSGQPDLAQALRLAKLTGIGLPQKSCR